MATDQIAQALATITCPDILNDYLGEIVDTATKSRRRARGIELYGDNACTCCGRNLVGKFTHTVLTERVGPTCAKKIAKMVKEDEVGL